MVTVFGRSICWQYREVGKRKLARSVQIAAIARLSWQVATFAQFGVTQPKLSEKSEFHPYLPENGASFLGAKRSGNFGIWLVWERFPSVHVLALYSWDPANGVKMTRRKRVTLCLAVFSTNRYGRAPLARLRAPAFWACFCLNSGAWRFLPIWTACQGWETFHG